MPEAENTPKSPPNPSMDFGVVPADRVDLIPEEELRNLLLQTNPKALRDLDLIEKGAENFFLFNYSPFALIKTEQLQFLKQTDLKYFEEKNGFINYQYLYHTEETVELGIANVVIRPASRRADQIQKIKSACIAQSVAAFLQYLNRRDQTLNDRRSTGELRDWVLKQYLNFDEKGNPLDIMDSKTLPQSLRNLRTISVESFLLRNFKLSEEALASIISILTKRPTEILDFMGQIKSDPEVILALEKRGGRPPLLRLNPDSHLVQPSLDELVGDLSNEKDLASDESLTEFEIIAELYTNIARRTLQVLLPSEQASWIQPLGMDQGSEYLEELTRHPAFTSSKTWEGADYFLQAYEVLINSMKSLSNLRRESIANIATNQVILKIRESKEPLVIEPSSIKLKDGILQKAGLPKSELFEQILEKVRARTDFLKREKTTGNSPGLVVLAVENVVPAFINEKERRTSIHNLIRKNGQPKGIYAFLREVVEGVDPEGIIAEQIRLSKVISEWEKEVERLRLKAEQDSKSFVVKLIEWILSLFGIKISAGQKKDFEPVEESSSQRTSSKETQVSAPKESTEAPKKKKSLGVLLGPKEKQMLIPAKIQKAIDYVDRRNNGLIWVDEVVNATSSPEFGKDKVGDLMYYDQKRRYIEIRSMNSVRHVFIRKELESDTAWLESTLEYLENVTAKKPEFAALAETLRKFRDE
ncbi:hypothetical protein CH373_13020 [Leptospira perolatii]|uniref:Uncharacterized protein n=1 Tax=Leptospira perolatii TaxID=2023191 RepID=A0A2M9ZKN5_9LEPT|nr:hypothetical protein [Leptospira perolatii]PJZ69965.1 hypothetical protein CH360_08665 [Leptospira perolatii]PJZ72627.1 hypothetical protein CH373_13020 [Leptospira perolatii]